MKKLAILASVVVLAAASANCSSSHEQGGAGSVFAPSDLGGDATAARGGGGGKPKPTSTGGSGSLTLVMVTDNNGDGLPNWGDQITFTVSTTATTEPNVSVTCSQNGSTVYSAATGYYDAYPWPGTKIMTLRSDVWTGGSSTCTAKLYYFSGTSTINLTSISFAAGA